MNFQQIRLPVDTLISRIRSGQLALPDFQRDFVWTPSQIAELLDTVARQWPMGSLLLLNGSKIFAAREIDGAPKLSADGANMYLLDGQQRITSLYHAVTDTSRYCYFVNFNELSEDTGETVKWMSRGTFQKMYGDLALRAQLGVALVRDVWEGATFYEWLGKIKSEQRRLQYMRLRDEKLSGFHSMVYQIMAIELEEGIGLEALARIFETINRTGVALNAFDLLVAKLYPSRFYIRERWEAALNESSLLRHFAPNEIEIMKLVSLLIRKELGASASKGVRQGDILSLKVEAIINNWEPAVQLYIGALKKAVEYGVVCRDLVPSWSMILGLAGCNLWLDERQTFDWWRDAILRQSFAQGANTRIVAEFDSQMRTEFSTEEPPLSSAEILRKPIRANGLLSKGIASLLIKHQARDPESGKLLLGASSVLMKALDELTGSLRNVRVGDPISSLVLVSGESEGRLDGAAIAGGPYWKAGLISQGIDEFPPRRGSGHIRQVFDWTVS